MTQRKKIEVAMLRTGDAAKALGISRRTLHTITAEGRIPCCKISSRLITYRVSDLEQFVNDHTVGANK